jgi:hypothetical protein
MSSQPVKEEDGGNEEADGIELVRKRKHRSHTREDNRDPKADLPNAERRDEPKRALQAWRDRRSQDQSVCRECNQERGKCQPPMDERHGERGVHKIAKRWLNLAQQTRWDPAPKHLRPAIGYMPSLQTRRERPVGDLHEQGNQGSATCPAGR